MQLVKFIFSVSIISSFSTHVLSQTVDEISKAHEKVFYNGSIFTANKNQPYAEAVSVRGNKIVAVGNYTAVKKTVTANAIQIDLKKGFLLPGFIDSHEHAIDGGEGLTRANTFDELILHDSLAAFADDAVRSGKGMAGDFLVIDGINIATWSHIAELNNIFNNGKYTNMPVLLRGSDGHTAWANNAVLQRAGLDRAYIESLNDERKKYFDFDESFTPNGFFADSGFDKINPVVPSFNTDWLVAGQEAMKYNNSYGITAWLDPAAGNISSKSSTLLDTYKLLAEKNLLTAHIRTVVVADANADPLPQINALRSLQKKYNSTKNLSVLGFKIFADGVVESPTQTAALSKPYLNKPSSGVLMLDPGKFAKFVIAQTKRNCLFTRMRSVTRQLQKH